MNFSIFFIKNPVFAIIFNLMTVVCGFLSLSQLNVREYPKVDIPIITVSARYFNASPEVIESSVTNILEDELASVENIENIESISSAGHSKIRMKFKDGTSMNKALTSVRDAVGFAKDRLPRNAREPAIYRSNGNDEIPFILLALESDSMNAVDLNHFAKVTIKNALRSIEGVSSVEINGEEYIMKVNTDPKKLYEFDINADEIYNALSEENMFKPIGKLRDIIPATMDSELKNVQDFEQTVLRYKTNSGKSKKAVLLKDIAEIKLSSENSKKKYRVNCKEAVIIEINIAADANPIKVSQLIKKEVQKINKEISSEFKLTFLVDRSEFIKAAVSNIRTDIFEAIIWVFFVILIFLRKIRPTLIPIITIPISLAGSCIFLKICGFSINMMTLFGLVLAVGLVVDDAIVVSENIYRYVREKLSPLNASIKGIKEVNSAIIAMTFTLVSVYMPFLFISGTIGQLFSEFAVALAGSVIISGFTALTLSPFMCSRIFTKEEKSPPVYIWISKTDHFLNVCTEKYKIFLKSMIYDKKISYIIMCCSIVFSLFLITVIPFENTPKEDRGLVFVKIFPLYGKDIDYHEKLTLNISKTAEKILEIKNSIGFIGENHSFLYLPLIDKKKRNKSAEEIANSLSEKFRKITSQEIHIWSETSSLPGIHNNSGIPSYINIIISTINSYEDLYEKSEKIKKDLSETYNFENLRHNLDFGNLSYKIILNTDTISQLGISKGQIAKALEISFSGNRDLTFQRDGISYDVIIESIDKPWDISNIYISNPFNKKISLAEIAKLEESTDLSRRYHKNQMRSAILSFKIKNNETPQKTLKNVMQFLDNTLPPLYKKFPPEDFESLKKFSETVIKLFFLAIFFIYAILSLQFNNFKDPLIIILTVPFACFGALFCMRIFKISLNIYSAVGLITLIGIITKHAIMIVEFSNQLVITEKSVINAVYKATLIRLRPILMTATTTILGVISLIFSRDYGSETRISVGMVIVGGLLFGTFFVLTVFPALCCVFKDENFSPSSKVALCCAKLLKRYFP